MGYSPSIRPRKQLCSGRHPIRIRIRAPYVSFSHWCAGDETATRRLPPAPLYSGDVLTKSFSVLALCFLVAAPSAGQKFGEKIEVKLIEVEAVVTDREGNPVEGLTAADFEISEGRRRQKITNFSEYRGSDSGRNEGSPSSDGTAANAVSAPPGTVVVLIDWLPRFGLVRERVYPDLAELLGGLVEDGHQVAILLWTPGVERLTSLLEPSRDPAAVRRAVDRLAGVDVAHHRADAVTDLAREKEFLDSAARMGADQEQEIDVSAQLEASRRFTAEADLMRFRRKSRALERLIGSMAGREGRKALLYISNEYSIPPRGEDRVAKIGMISELTKTANANGVTFYAVKPATDSNGVMGTAIEATPADLFDFSSDQRGTAAGDSQADLGQHLEALSKLTGPTGGILESGASSVGALGRRLTQDLTSYYSIAYQTRSDGRDRERRIVVKVKNRAYRVRARQAFVEKSDETLAREALIARLFADEGSNQLEFEIRTGARRPNGRKRWLLPVELRIPTGQLEFAAENGKEVAHMKILVASANSLAEITAINDNDLQIIAGVHDQSGFITYTFELEGEERGSLVSVGVFDRRTGLVGVETIDNRAAPPR